MLRLLLNASCAGVILVAVMFSGTCFAADALAVEADFEVTASQREINEGDVVEFDIINKQYIDSSSRSIFDLEADLSSVEWDFGSGESSDTAFGLYNIKNRFLQDSAQPKVVKVVHQNTSRQVSIKVNNVAPAVLGVSFTKPAVKGTPVVFQAIAKDPGIEDTLVYKWTFGDLRTATGRVVRHTYANDGRYEVKLTVSDEHETRGGTFSVQVGDKLFVPGELAVNGDITVNGAEIDGAILVGSTADPTNPSAGGVCQVRLEFRSSKHDTAFTLTGLFNSGLAPGHYNIGKTTEWSGQHKNDAAAVGTFFADWSAPSALEYRNFGGRRVGGPFWSNGGRVTITQFDGETVALNFEASLTENIPGTYDPRKVNVIGGVTTSLSTGDVSNVTQDTTLGEAGIQFSPPGRNMAGLNLKAYFCGGEEPQDFELVSTLPSANETNAEFQDTTIEATFTQAVDPDSLADNAFVKVRTSDGYLDVPGGWRISPKNRNTAHFVPQATLLPGVVHCVILDVGADGIRSFGGNTLAGSAQPRFSPKMAPACDNADGGDGSDTRQFAFSTQVELTSAWVDFYQASLAGGSVKLVPGKPTIARVYPYWRPRSDSTHPAAQVTEFSANVFVNRDRQQFLPMQRAVIKRPDLFTEDDRRKAKNSVNLTGNAPTGSEAAPAFAVIKPLANNGAPVRSAFPGAVSEVNLWPNANLEKFKINTVGAQGVCPAGEVSDTCNWNQELQLESILDQINSLFDPAVRFVSENLPVVRVSSSTDFSALPCSDGFEEGVCMENGQYKIQPQGPLEERPANVARRLAQMVVDSDKLAHLTVAFVAPGLLPDPDNEPVHMYVFDYPMSPVILAQAGRANAFELGTFIVASVLGNSNGCHHFAATEDCERPSAEGFRESTREDHPWTVQGYRLSNIQDEWEDYLEVVGPIANKHHAEGNEESEQLIPLLRSGERNMTNSFISAYNYKRLFAPIANRTRLYNEDHP